MLTVIHTPMHRWLSAVLGSEIVVDPACGDNKSSLVIPIVEWEKNFQIYFAVGYEIDQWDEVEFGPEYDDEDYLLDKFFGQETPIFMNGFIEVVPGMDGHRGVANSGRTFLDIDSAKLLDGFLRRQYESRMSRIRFKEI